MFSMLFLKQTQWKCLIVETVDTILLVVQGGLSICAYWINPKNSFYSHSLPLQATLFLVWRQTRPLWVIWSPRTSMSSCAAQSRPRGLSSSCSVSHGSCPWWPSWAFPSSWWCQMFMGNTTRLVGAIVYGLRLGACFHRRILVWSVTFI